MTEPAVALDSPADSGFSVQLREPWLVVRFGAPVRAVSWAIVGGGFVDSECVAWLEIKNDDLRPPVDPRALFIERMRTENLTGSIGLLTSRRVATYRDVIAVEGSIHARCIATVGLGNALRVGDSLRRPKLVGTINILAHVDVPLTDAALLEASSIAAEAKCAAMLEADVASRISGKPSTGTGTDCTVIACPLPGRRNNPHDYAGKHTTVGSVLGRAVSQAVGEGIAAWCKETGL